jgi:hypothetical protein
VTRKKKPTYRIRCQDCGYETDNFHGWVFAISKCYTPGKPNMIHNWKAVEDEQVDPEDRGRVRHQG